MAPASDRDGTVHESDYGASNFRVYREGAKLSLTLTHPPYTDTENRDGRVRYVEVDQESVRASDGIRLWYDFERDGWVIEKPTIDTWASDDGVCDEGWREVAFAPTWAFESAESEAEAGPAE